MSDYTALCAFASDRSFTLFICYLWFVCIGHLASRCVWCILSDIEEEPIRQHFSVCGAVTNVRVIRDQKTGAGKGFGYVTFVVM